MTRYCVIFLLMCFLFSCKMSASGGSAETALFLFKEGKKYGYIDIGGNVAIEAMYDKAFDFSGGLACVYIGNKCGYINSFGKFIIGLKYDYGLRFSEGLACVSMSNKWGYVNDKGKVIVDFKYDSPFDNPWGVFPIEPFCKIPEPGMFSQGLAVVKKDGKYGYVDKTGNEVIPLKYAYADDFSSGLAPVQRYISDDTKGIPGNRATYGFINKKGETVIDFTFKKAMSFSDDVAAVLDQDNKWGYINTSGEYVINSVFDLASSFYDGLACVQIGEYTAYINKYGKVQIPIKYGIKINFPHITYPVFYGGWNFSENMAAVIYEDELCYIDKHGEIVISGGISDGNSFSNGLALIEIKCGKYAYVNTKGNLVWVEK